MNHETLAMKDEVRAELKDGKVIKLDTHFRNPTKVVGGWFTFGAK